MDVSEKHNYYYTGGLAELVQNPSDLTFSFFSSWFTGQHSVGLAMKLLHLPYEPVPESIFVLEKNTLYVDLQQEEATLYAKTIFSYSPQVSPQQAPKLTIQLSKVGNPLYLLNTLKILFQQSMWIAFPEKSIEIATKFLDSIPYTQEDLSIDKVDKVLKEEVWPNVLAISMLHEFYSQLLQREAKNELGLIHQYISQKLSHSDWFYLSLADQLLVKEGSLSFETYIERYRLRADKDYELTCPRWYEIPEEISLRIQNLQKTLVKTNEPIEIKNARLQTLADQVVQFQDIRMEAKHKALLWIDRLRQLLIQKEQLSNKRTTISLIRTEATNIQLQTHGQGLPISQGKSTGIARYITKPANLPADTIGIFASAGTDLSHQYTQCAGLIFLSGGQMSHGSIVAREYHIPALIDSKAQHIPERSTITINGTTGTWKVVT